MAFHDHFVFLNGHATFQACMSTPTLLLFMFDNVTSPDVVSTIYALHGDKCTYSFMVFYLTLQTFCAALFESFAFDGMIGAVLVMLCHLQVVEHLLAAHHMISTLELHLHQFLLHFFFHANEA